MVLREKGENQDSTIDWPFFLLFYQEVEMIPGSIRTFWYKGFASYKANLQVRKKGYISQKQQPRLEGWLWEKGQVWCLELNIEEVAYNTTYLTYNVKYLIYK